MLYFRLISSFIPICLALLGLSISSVNAAVVWDWNAGTNTLFSAQNVVVEGHLYDVQFVDGSCIELFSGCDEVGDFAFTNIGEAQKASQALFDQVLIDDMGAPAPFDTNFLLTNGCEDNIYFEACGIVTPTLDAFYFLIPFSLYRGSSSAWNTALEEHPDAFKRDRDVSVSGSEYTDYSLNESFVYADWTRVSAVPVPAAVWLFGTALIGLVGFSRRRKVA